MPINGEKQIGICGTFDLENFGDLLFPLLAEEALTRRLGPIRLRRFSYRRMTVPSWMYDVEPASALPEAIHELDAMLIGGGFLIRFDKDVAPAYQPDLPAIHHPT